MAKIFGIPRPQPAWGIEWTGDNIQEIKDAFAAWPGSMFFVNEENGNLCFGITVEDANQYPVGTIITLMGGVGGMTQSDWDEQYSTVDSADRLKYNVAEDVAT
jgi:hypothetical protein